ncbi:hypothetical protein Q8A73_017218 [Channa argus]|nr:hypothetical protein Q8A73_017218 [Channa argus]
MFPGLSPFQNQTLVLALPSAPVLLLIPAARLGPVPVSELVNASSASDPVPISHQGDATSYSVPVVERVVTASNSVTVSKRVDANAASGPVPVPVCPVPVCPVPATSSGSVPVPVSERVDDATCPGHAPVSRFLITGRQAPPPVRFLFTSSSPTPGPPLVGSSRPARPPEGFHHRCRTPARSPQSSGGRCGGPRLWWEPCGGWRLLLLVVPPTIILIG